jgi:hypothetical protein
VLQVEVEPKVAVQAESFVAACMANWLWWPAKHGQYLLPLLRSCHRLLLLLPDLAVQVGQGHAARTICGGAMASFTQS